ncbi:MAG: DNA polymerase III subunit delta [Candidatus Omnitrophota bacterium]
MVRHPLYLLAGKEEFLKREFIQDLRQSLFPKDPSNPNFQEFSADKDPLSAALDFVGTAPFLSEARLAVLRDVDELSDEEKEALLAYAGRPAPTGVLVVVSEETSAKKNDFLRKLSAQAKLVPCYPPFEKEIPSWIHARAKKKGIHLDGDAAAILAERLGKDLLSLDGVLEQAAVFASPRTQISLKDIDGLLGRSVQADVFELADAILEKNAKTAFGIVTTLLEEGSRAFEIVPVLAGQFDRLLRGSALLAEGRSSEEIGTELRIHSFYLEKFMRQARRVPAERAAEIFRRLLSCDEAIKTSRLSDALALERFVLEVC